MNPGTSWGVEVPGFDIPCEFALKKRMGVLTLADHFRRTVSEGWWALGYGEIHGVRPYVHWP